MKIKSELTEKGVSVTGMIAVPEIGISITPINFRIDTGADITTLSEFEAEKIGIDYKTLEKDSKPSITMAGPAENYKIKNAILIFSNEDNSTKEFEMNLMHVSHFPIRGGKRGSRDTAISTILPNLLGKDFLAQNEMTLIADFKKYYACLEY